MSAPQSISHVPAPRRSRFLSVMGRWPFRKFSERAERLREGVLRRRVQAALGSLASTTLFYDDERVWVARLERGLSARVVRRENLKTVTSMLDHANVPFFAVPDETKRHASIGIVDDDWGRFVSALEAHSHAVPLYLGIEFLAPDGRRSRGVVDVKSPEAERALRSQGFVEVFHFFSGPQPSKTYGRTDACRIERWTRDADGTLVAPRRNNRAAVLDVTSQAPAKVSVHAIDLPTFEPFNEKSPFEFNEPIDVVYLWVDGRDSDWQKRRDAVVERLTGSAPKDSIDPSRFRDNGELRYSLRSIHQHCDWVRNIILVTDDQTPPWLDASHPKIRMVNHRELFGQDGTLPTFNSHAIASRIHHIEGLSEMYLVMNDDVFVGHDVGPSRFFHSNGIGKFFLSQTTHPRLDSYTLSHEAARENSIDLIERDYGVRPTRVFYHTPVPQLKSHLANLESKYPDVFRITQSNQLRSPRDYEINGWLHHYMGYLDGRLVPASIPYNYFNLGDADVVQRMHSLAQSRWAATFCINDDPRASTDTLRFLPEWLEAYYPLPAPWERDSPRG